ncbi:MAG: DUF4416 family protein [Arcobacteraceae bacterium]
MGQIYYPNPVKLIFSIIGNEDYMFLEAKVYLTKIFGKIDMESEFQNFDFTDYYKKEMGDCLKQQLISFEKLIIPTKLSIIKHISNKMELTIATNNNEGILKKRKRRINLDPGYLTLSKFILASTKDGSARIYLNHGIYAEITLSFIHKTFQPLDWTYLNYQTFLFINFLNDVRKKYKDQINIIQSSQNT